MPRIDRRTFLRLAGSFPALLSAGSFGRSFSAARWNELDRAWLRESSVALALESGQPLPVGDYAGAVDERADFTSLPSRFPDLARHFLFEYYPWYGVEPWRHWDAASRVPPHDVATHYVPRLGPTIQEIVRSSSSMRAGSRPPVWARSPCPGGDPEVTRTRSSTRSWMQ